MDNSVKNILLNYITGKASEEEKAFAEEWIAASPENERAYIELYENWHKALATQHELLDTEEAYERFVSENSNRRPLGLGYKRTVAYAATVLIFVVIGLFFYMNNSREEIISWHVVEVAKGQTSKLTLPDGTKVFINAGSSLKYNSNFGVKKRDIILDGEARFDIAKSQDNVPFIVNASGFIIRDIGTIFNVKAYNGDQSFETSVLEGEVSIEGKISGEDKEESKVFVNAKQLIRINKKNNEVATIKKETKLLKVKPLQIIDFSEENQEDYNGWINNIVAFNDASFQDVSQTLNRRFNVNIQLEDQMLEKFHYTGTFKDPENVYKILNIIAQTTPITYHTKGQDIVIKMKTN